MRALKLLLALLVLLPGLLVLLVLLPGLAAAQQGVQLSGPATPGHTISLIGGTSPAFVQDAGPANGGVYGTGLAELNITQRAMVPPGTAPNNSPFCLNDGPISGPYHQLCLTPNNGAGAGVLTWGAYNGAAAEPFACTINGVATSPCLPGGGAGGGNVIASGTVTSGQCALFTGTGFDVVGGACGSGGSGSPGGSLGQIQFNSAGSFGGFTMGGDGTLNTGTGALIVTKTNGTPFGTAAVANLGSSGAALGLLNGNLTFSGTDTFSILPNLPLLAGDLLVGSNANVATAATLSGDCVLSSAGAITCTKTNGTAFATSATTDTTNASNISSGTVAVARLPLATSSVVGAVRPDNTTITISAGVLSAVSSGAGNVVASGTPTNGQCALFTGTSFNVTGGACGSSATVPGGSSGQIQFNSAGSFGGFTVGGDGTLNTGTGALIVTKTNGTAFAASATTDTTNASNISSGTVAVARLPLATSSVVGAVRPDNTTITISAGVLSAVSSGAGNVVASGTPTNGQCALFTGTSFNVTGGACGSSATVPGGSSGQIQFNSAGSFGGFTVGGDGTLNTGTGALIVTKTNGTAFAASATTDTTNASNISSGTVAVARLPLATSSVVGAVRPDNTTITISAGVLSAVSSGAGNVVASGTPTNGQCALFTGTGFNVTGGQCAPPGGTSGQIQYDNAGVLGGFTMGGDCTIVTSTGVITCTKTNGTSFGTAATANTGTSGATLGLLNGNLTFGGSDVFTSLPSLPLASADILVGNGSAVAAVVALSGDCTLANTGAITCLDTNGVAFGTAATKNTGTSGGTLGLLNGNLTFGGTDTFTALPSLPLASTDILVGNGSAIAAAVALSGDCTLANTGAITCTKTNGTSFGTAATVNTGTSGATLGLLNGNLTFGGTDIFSSVPTLPNQTANTVFAGPSSGSAAAPAFRGVVLADLPALAAYQTYCSVTSSSAAPIDCHTILHSLDFNAVGNGTTDDTTSLQTWLSACGTQHAFCILDQPSSFYKISSALTISGQTVVTGSALSARIAQSSTTADGIDITASDVVLANLGLAASVTQTAGSCLHVGSSGSLVSLTTIDNISIPTFNCFNAIFMDDASAWVIKGGAVAASNDAIEVAAAGDSTITLTQINGEAAGVAFVSSSSGGLRIVNNKFNTGTATGPGVLLQPASGDTASDLIIANNSIEGYPTGISLTKGGGTSFANTQIYGNEFSDTTACVSTDTNSGWLTQTLIQDNMCGYTGTGFVIGAAATGFAIQDNITEGGGGSGLAFTVASGATNGSVGNNVVLLTSASPNFTNASTTTLIISPSLSTLGQTFNGFLATTATALPAAAAGQLAISGVSTQPTLGANGEGAIWLNNAAGLKLSGEGSTNDIVLSNDANTSVLAIPTGTSHLTTAQATAPTVSSCGTGSPAVTSGSTDIRGSVTTGTAATGCVITFNHSWSPAPFCAVTANSNVAVGSSTSTTALTTTMGSLTGAVIYWLCLG